MEGEPLCSNAKGTNEVVAPHTYGAPDSDRAS